MYATLIVCRKATDLLQLTTGQISLTPGCLPKAQLLASHKKEETMLRVRAGPQQDSEAGMDACMCPKDCLFAVFHVGFLAGFVNST